MENDRSQHRNRATAMGMLKARLYELELRRREEAAAEASKSEIGWGHQLRSYVLQPYQMVKDLRTNVETSDTQGVLDGDLDPFEAALAQRLVARPKAKGSGNGDLNHRRNRARRADRQADHTARSRPRIADGEGRQCRD